MKQQTHLRRRNIAKILAAAGAWALAAGISFAEPPAGDPRPGPGPNERRGDPPPEGRGGDRGERNEGPDATPPQVEELSGTVQRYNLSPHGSPDAVMIRSEGKVIQINCPPDVGVAIALAVPAGDSVKVSALAERGVPEHGVYRLLKLTTSKGQSFVAGPQQPTPPAHVDGTVKELNYGRGGEVIGAILENGDFVLVGPRSAEELKLAVGQKLSIDGIEHPMVLGHNLIQAQTVNGVAIAFEGPGRGPREGGPEDHGRRDAGPGDAPRQRDGGGPGDRPGPRGDGDRGGPGGPDPRARHPGDGDRPDGPPGDRSNRPPPEDRDH